MGYGGGSPCHTENGELGYFDSNGHCEAAIDGWDILFFLVVYVPLALGWIGALLWLAFARDVKPLGVVLVVSLVVYGLAALF